MTLILHVLEQNVGGACHERGMEVCSIYCPGGGGGGEDHVRTYCHP